MMAKILKSVIVVAAALTFFGGTAMADRWGRDYHHDSYHHNYHHNDYHQNRHARVAPRHDYRQPSHYASDAHSLAPRIVFFGGLPVPVPPPPNEVLHYLTGR
jgi:hypothetical protein